MSEDSTPPQGPAGDKTSADSAMAEGRRQFEARFEPWRPRFKVAIKAQNGFLAGLLFAEAKQARDAGNFVAAQETLGELEALIQQAEKREAEKLRKAEKKFKEDHKVLERKARFEGGVVSLAARRHLKTAGEFAVEKKLAKANQQLELARSIIQRGVNPPSEKTISSKSKPFTISGMPDFLTLAGEE